jgi:hypothetical protein
MEWYEVVIALLAAFGGGASVLRVIKMVMDWRRGVTQRASAPTERLVIHLEQRINELTNDVQYLKAHLEVEGAYITVLVFTMASAGLPVPPRPNPPEKPKKEV